MSNQTSIGSRLRQAIKSWRSGSIREFQRGMSALGAPRSTYPTINSYLKDESEPPPSFVTAAAKILGVRQEWLAFGTGRRTKQGERLARLADADRQADREPEYQAMFKAVPESESWSGVARAAFVDTVVALVESMPGKDKVTPGMYVTFAYDIKQILNAPMQLWGSPKDADSYVVGMLTVLRSTIPRLREMSRR